MDRVNPIQVREKIPALEFLYGVAWRLLSQLSDELHQRGGAYQGMSEPSEPLVVQGITTARANRPLQKHQQIRAIREDVGCQRHTWEQRIRALLIARIVSIKGNTNLGIGLASFLAPGSDQLRWILLFQESNPKGCSRKHEHSFSTSGQCSQACRFFP